MEYKILVSESARNLEDEVNQMVDKGWEPTGGVSVRSTTTGDRNGISTSSSFLQAMTKQVEKK